MVLASRVGWHSFHAILLFGDSKKSPLGKNISKGAPTYWGTLACEYNPFFISLSRKPIKNKGE